MDVVTALETGVRHGDVITVTREAPETGKTRVEWEKPREKQGYYVSQVDLYLMGKLLPHDNIDMGFYAYAAGAGRTGNLSLRTERVMYIPNSDELIVFSRPLADQGEQISHYDSKGIMTKRLFPSTRELVSTTEKQLRAIWKIEKPKK